MNDEQTILALKCRVLKLEDDIKKLKNENARLERKVILSDTKAKVYHEQLLHLAESAHKMVLAQKAVAESLE